MKCERIILKKGMIRMDTRLYPIKPEVFKAYIQPIIEKSHKRDGRPPKISHWQFFSAVLYVLRTGVAWRDLPRNFGPWHTIYTRFKRWSESGLFWEIIYTLQQHKRCRMDIVWVDSTSHKVHRHGAGAPKKRDSKFGNLAGGANH